MKFDGKVVVVTGASKGIGASVALHLAKEGASVVVNYSTSKERADKVVNEIIQAGGNAVAIQANLAYEQEIQRLFLESYHFFGKIDILINNAGVYEFFPLEEITAAHYHKIFDLNVLGLLLATKEAVKYFGASGSIVNISSIASTLALETSAVYSASKAAVDVITKSLSKELGPRNIRVNCVNPAVVETEGTHAAGLLQSDFRKNFEAKTPLGRIGHPSDIASAVIFLASDDASWITGQTLIISGGFQ